MNDAAETQPEAPPAGPGPGPGPMPVPNPPSTPPPPAPAPSSAPAPAAPALDQAVADATALAGEASADVHKLAAEALAAAYRDLPGVVREVIGGNTVEEVKASLAAAKQAYAGIRTSIMQEFAAMLPGGHAQAGGAPAPTDAFGLISAGLKQKA